MQPKSVLKIRKCEFDGCFDDEDGLPSEDSDGNNVSNVMARKVIVVIKDLTYMHCQYISNRAIEMLG